jgi:uncharacterized protein (TIGR02145 family)
MKNLLIILLALCPAVFGQNASNSVFTDPRDGKQYKIVEIGNQIWMAENLSYNANGSKCYNNQESNCQKYGSLYNWAAAKTACPSGWHLPSDGEWQTLVDFAGGKEIAGKKLKAKSGWNNDKEGNNGNGTDEFGFSALPGGGGYSDGSFYDVGYSGRWWSSSENYAAFAWRRSMYRGIANVGRNYHGKSYFFSVRCVQDCFKICASVARAGREKNQ